MSLCKIVINHRPSYLPGKYGATVHPPGNMSAKVIELEDDAALERFLISLAFNASEIAKAKEDLKSRNADIVQTRELPEDVASAFVR